MDLLQDIKNKILDGGMATDDEVMSLAAMLDDAESAGSLDRARRELWKAAEAVTAHWIEPKFSSCSIVNARSGRCSENCKWCAQSAHYDTHCDIYDIVDEDECMAAARHNADKGVMRFSLVASGRRVSAHTLDRVCHLLRRVRTETGINTCASLGLLGPEDMRRLVDVGVTRYHCNLETAPSHFGTLCTTHTIDDKLATIRAAHEAGLQVCSGGIIGMGETRSQRAEFAVTLRRAGSVSIPINILSPIPGTPLQDMTPIGDEDILDTVAIMRLAHPHTELRFAGGRRRLSRELQIRAMRIGINGGIVGDLLTTVGSTIDEDKKLAAKADRKF